MTQRQLTKQVLHSTNYTEHFVSVTYCFVNNIYTKTKNILKHPDNDRLLIPMALRYEYIIVVASQCTFPPAFIIRSKSASRPIERAFSVSATRKYDVCSGRHVLSYCSRNVLICKVNQSICLRACVRVYMLACMHM